MATMKILLTGSNGYIAKKIASFFEQRYKIYSISRQDFDLTSPYFTKKFFQNYKPNFFDCVIHTAITGGNRLKKESYDDLCGNLKMFNNLLVNKNKFKKLINLGSGAETYGLDTYYGLSKKIISKIIEETSNFYNLRIFSVFDEDEDERRFIKSNLKRYINKENIVIYEDKYMDFIHMNDFIKVVEYYIKTKTPEHSSINLCYKTKYKLSDIAEIINSLSSYNVKIINHSKGSNYCDTGTLLHELNIIDDNLQNRIFQTYNKLLI